MDKMEVLYNIFKELQSDSSRTGKEKILTREKNNDLFKEVLKFVYNPFIVTGLSDKKINKLLPLGIGYVMKIVPLEDILSYLEVNNTGRDTDIHFIQHCISQHKPHIQELLKQICTKSLKVGLTAKTINKVYGKNFIPEFGVQLAKSYADNEHKVDGYFFLTQKLDGNRCICINRGNGDIKFFTRTGQLIEGLVELKGQFQYFPPFVYDGELLLSNENNLSSDELFRLTQKEVRKDGMKKNIEFHVFDFLSIEDFENGKSSNPYWIRRGALDKVFSDVKFEFYQITKNINLLPILYEGNDKSEIIKWSDWAKKNNLEGIMLNTGRGLYETKRTEALLKVKVFADCDVLVTDILEGTGKNKGKLGAITIQFEHNKQLHECNVGSGFSDEERIMYYNYPNLLLNKIVTIGYFEVSQNQDGGYGLRFPTWKSIIRDDKDEISMN